MLESFATKIPAVVTRYSVRRCAWNFQSATSTTSAVEHAAPTTARAVTRYAVSVLQRSPPTHVVATTRAVSGADRTTYRKSGPRAGEPAGAPDQRVRAPGTFAITSSTKLMRGLEETLDAHGSIVE